MAKKNKKTDSPTRSGAYSPQIINKKARFNYQLLEKLEAGLVLLGSEVKSLRQGKASLEEAYCRISGGELYLIGCTIAQYDHSHITNHEPNRTRKLLVHRRELHKIETKLSQKGLTVVPLRIYFSRGRAKIEIALAQGKSYADKREKLKERQMNRDVSREIRKWR
ncbi:MAG: SsrA-binding protein SmpB [Sedimentisphaerales bacterium]|nr:SsrA-binding protein SmpB [Sedimentisphaerales bacterium]